MATPKKGDRVELVSCNDPYTKLEPGARGTVVLVDFLGTVHVKWDSGSSLGLCADDGDFCIILGQEEESDERHAAHA